MIRRSPWALGLVVAASLLVAGCSAASSPAAVATAVAYGSLGAGFYDPAHPPAPEGTLTPPTGSWDDAHPPAGYTAILVTFGSDAQTTTLRAAVANWASAESVQLRTLEPSTHAALIDGLLDAVRAKPDLIITVGNAMVDPVAAISPSYLDQDFLLVGAEIAEPTANVTAADWTGAGFRGEGLGTPTAYDPATFTAERAGRALRAGVGAVVNEVTGIVVWVG